MASARGCNLPDDLLYDVDNHIWYRELPDGNVKLGMTAVATAMAGQLVAYTPKKVGRTWPISFTVSVSPSLLSGMSVTIVSPSTIMASSHSATFFGSRISAGCEKRGMSG